MDLRLYVMVRRSGSKKALDLSRNIGLKSSDVALSIFHGEEIFVTHN